MQSYLIYAVFPSLKKINLVSSTCRKITLLVKMYFLKNTRILFRSFSYFSLFLNRLKVYKPMNTSWSRVFVINLNKDRIIINFIFSIIYLNVYFTVYEKQIYLLSKQLTPNTHILPT